MLTGTRNQRYRKQRKKLSSVDRTDDTREELNNESDPKN